MLFEVRNACNRKVTNGGDGDQHVRKKKLQVIDLSWFSKACPSFSKDAPKWPRQWSRRSGTCASRGWCCRRCHVYRNRSGPGPWDGSLPCTRYSWQPTQACKTTTPTLHINNVSMFDWGNPSQIHTPHSPTFADRDRRLRTRTRSPSVWYQCLPHEWATWVP